MITVWRLPIDQKDRTPSDAAWAYIPPILAKTLDTKTTNLSFAKTERGRPYVESPFSVDFNLAHSRKTALLAVATNGRVGIDIEERRRISEPLDIGMTLFGLELTRRLGALHGVAREDMFLRLWVRAEALLKATGEGLPPSGAALDEPGLWPGATNPIRRRGRVWSLFDQPVGKNHWAAISIEGKQTNHSYTCKLASRNLAISR